MTPPNIQIIVPGDRKTTLQFCADHFMERAQEAIEDHGFFAVALAGGSTPREVYELLALPDYAETIEWDKVQLFWGDERNVPPTDPESNYHMAMKAGFEKLLVPPFHIHRMVGEKLDAEGYEKTVRKILPDRSFDLVILGVGEDGHTASLFPDTEALAPSNKLALAYFVPQKKCWRMSLTLEAINDAENTVFYVLGANKAPIVKLALTTKPHLPCQLIGTADHPALWIVDEDGVKLLQHSRSEQLPQA